MNPWVVNVTNVISSTGDLTQLYPSFTSAGSDALTLGALVRQPTDGVLLECAIYPVDAFGGILELWDLAGPLTGSTNVNSGTAITNAQLTAAIARGRAKRIWSQSFKADSGLTTKKFTQRVPVMFGLAVRVVDNAGGGGAGTQIYTLNLVCGGCYRITQRII